MTEALALRARAGSDHFPLIEAFFDRETWRLAYLAVETGGWFSHTDVVLAARLFGAPDIDAKEWPVTVEEEAVKTAPEWSGGSVPWLVDALPPVFVGPFGNTTSPLMMQAILADAMDDDEGGAVDAKAGDRAVRRFEHFGAWRDRPVFGVDGEFGPLTDLIFETSDGRITHFGVEFDGGIVAVPVGRLHSIPEGGTHLVLDLSRADITAAYAAAELESLSDDQTQRLA